MSSEGPSESISNVSRRLHNLRLNHEANHEDNEEAAGGAAVALVPAIAPAVAEADNAEAFNDSPQNMQPAGNFMLNRARRALTFACDEEQASISARSGEPSTSNCDK